MSRALTKGEYTIPAELQEFFETPPILISESLECYERVRASTIEMVEPQNTFEWLLVKDLVDLSWEIRRLAKEKADLVNLTCKEALRMIIESLWEDEPEECRRVARKNADIYFWSKDGRDWVVKFLAKRKLTEDVIAAQAATLRLPELEIFDRQLERARVTRMAIARDLEHHRAAGFWKKPDELLQIVDAKVDSIPLDPSNNNDALAK
jgi:hypothetical protein